MNKTFIIPLFILLTSCNATNSIGMLGLTAISIIILLIFSAMFFFIIKRKKKSDRSLSVFSADVKNMLDEIKSPEERIKALKSLIVRIDNDKKYDKTPDWKKSVLAKVHEHIAKEYHNTGDEKGIVEACTNIINFEPSNGMAYYNRGSIYNNWGEYEKALPDFKDALILLPHYSSIYNNKGLALDRLGRFEEALEDFNYAIELEPSAIIYYNRANLYFEQEKYKEAKEDYKKYMELDLNDDSDLTECVVAAMEYLKNKLAENNE